MQSNLFFKTTGFFVLALFFCGVTYAQNEQVNTTDGESAVNVSAGNESTPSMVYDSIRSQQIDYPAKILLESGANLHLPIGYSFISKQNANTLLNMMGNQGGDGLQGMVVGTTDYIMEWFIVLRLNPLGYVVDKDAHKINGDALLKKIQREINNEYSYGAAQGVAQYNISEVSWIVPPTYDKNKKRLSWLYQTHIQGANEADPEQQGINYKNMLLFRHGFLQINCASSLANLESNKSNCLAVINSIDFTEGAKYSDYQAVSDKVAPVTVSQLISGKVDDEDGDSVENNSAENESVNKGENNLTDKNTEKTVASSPVLTFLLFLVLLLIAIGFIVRDVMKNNIKILK